MQLSERVHLIGSGQLGFHLTSDYDCNVYLLDGGNECALIDAGGGVEPERIIANIDAAGIAKERVKYLLITHAHGDHAAGAAFFREHYNLAVVCPAESAPWIASGDQEKNSLRIAREQGVYPADFQFSACPIDEPLFDGEAFKVGDIEVTLLETPGHARGHASYLWRDGKSNALFSGDVIFANGRIVLQSTWDCSIQDYSKTMARLHELHIDQLYPGHGASLLGAAHRDIEQAHSIFQSLAIPPNLI